MNMKMNSISVVCPTYNSSKYILRTLKSLVNQIKKPDEIIFSDDGSIDNTTEIIKNYGKIFEQNSIPFKILNNYHKGPGAARNYGIKASTKSWIAFLDSDDVWKPGKLKEVSEFILKGNSNCFLHWEEYINKNKKIVVKHGYNYFEENNKIFNQLYNRNFFSTSAIVCKKDILENNGGFDTSLPNAQDYDLWLKIADDIKLSIIPKVLGEYHILNNSITSRPYYKRIKAELIIANRYRNNVKLSSYVKKILRIIFSPEWIKLIYKYLKSKRFLN